ncbi:hypothetical protein Droror1_Dr00000535 [Drosera rotundifolia]
MEKNGSSSSTTIFAMRKAIRVLSMVIFTGYFMMWIMMPTMAYKMTWLPDLRAKLNSTYYGTQGPNLPVYTFLVLLVAVAGSIYLHLGKQASYHGHET